MALEKKDFVQIEFTGKVTRIIEKNEKGEEEVRYTVERRLINHKIDGLNSVKITTEIEN